jgi:Leucine-rich repeat (LRR) protein
MAADSHPGPPRLRRLTVTGPVSEESIQQVAQLLDLLPVTQKLRELMLEEAPGKHMQACYEVWVGKTAHAEIMQQAANDTDLPKCPTASSSNSSTGRHARRQPPSGEGWHSSCRALFVSLEAAATPALPVSILRPLLGPLQGLGVLALNHPQAAHLPLYAASLRGLRGLQISGLQDGGQEVADWVAGLPDLCYLRIGACDNYTLPMLVTFTCPSRLISLSLQGVRLDDAMLEGVCAATSLQFLNLHTSNGFTTLPDSISRLTGLQVLQLTQTEVVRLPECMTALTALDLLGWSLLHRTQALDLQIVWP